MSDEAERQLQDTCNTMVKGRRWESAYNVQMALVAILIFPVCQSVITENFEKQSNFGHVKTFNPVFKT